jgi:hypothetical protein
MWQIWQILWQIGGEFNRCAERMTGLFVENPGAN